MILIVLLSGTFLSNDSTSKEAKIYRFSINYAWIYKYSFTESKQLT